MNIRPLLFNHSIDPEFDTYSDEFLVLKAKAIPIPVPTLSFQSIPSPSVLIQIIIFKRGILGCNDVDRNNRKWNGLKTECWHRSVDDVIDESSAEDSNFDEEGVTVSWHGPYQNAAEHWIKTKMMDKEEKMVHFLELILCLAIESVLVYHLFCLSRWFKDWLVFTVGLWFKDWGNGEVRAFNTLKEKVTSAHILALQTLGCYGSDIPDHA
ncbi:hypothetical protein FNV43_RR27296 [Rhamnella rubrinervis]|uniref:Uncharacterized protein n=1 Tax=Rhamnella rubrinervis TaxID=2594499 RepID=A0A8K0DPQ1_9ROSA|nr:hypothetical protein FNV43_RR27296 [Rhamnella rubrinervis]